MFHYLDKKKNKPFSNYDIDYFCALWTDICSCVLISASQ